jgi:hypothetical protein
MFQCKSALAIVILLSLSSWTWSADVKAAPDAQAPYQWVPVEQDTWGIFLEAPDYHFAKARDSLANKDTRTAAAEIREGALLLRFQAKRLDASVSDLYALANQIDAGHVTAGAKVDEVTARATQSLDYRQPLIPVAQGEEDLFMQGSRYHVAQAKTKLKAKDRVGVAAEIHKAVAYVKLEAARSGREVHGDLKSGVVEMEALAKKAESGTDVAEKDLDKAYAKVRRAFTSHKS